MRFCRCDLAHGLAYRGNFQSMIRLKMGDYWSEPFEIDQVLEALRVYDLMTVYAMNPPLRNTEPRHC